eukprot:TRINITY_DN1062_c0_g1_i1.p1 TRINITY_DN1062_c0_g1~~TRINITY_DN1062_c0_g1_i1.p1  ORF type:complete len:155 (-),score=24.60 TRINITY_DN1062_c0_g1_i1:546-1010(-)
MLSVSSAWTVTLTFLLCLAGLGQAFIAGSHKAVHSSSFAGGRALTQPQPCVAGSWGSLVMSAGPQIEVVKTPTNEQLASLGVADWPTWGCDVSKFPWTYDEAETAYVLEGEVTVTPSDGRDAATFGKGDLVTFPQGMQCVWDVKKAISKHYRFG